jgi:polysaccharide biosynthesis protein PslE
MFLADLWRALRYHVWLILFVAVATVLVTYAAFQFVPDQYTSTARLLVKLGRENAELPLTVEKGGVMSMGVRKEEINSEIQLIASRPMIEAAVDRLGVAAFDLQPPPPKTWFQHVKAYARGIVRELRQWWKDTLILLNLRPKLGQREEAIVLVERTLLVEREKDSDVIAVSSKLPSGDLAMQVVNTVVALYLERRLEVRRDRGMSDFFDEQLRALRKQLDELDARKLSLRDGRKISGIGEERSLLLARLQQLQAEIANDERELKVLAPGGRAGSAPAANPASVSAVSLSSMPNLEQLRGKVTELRVRRGEQLQRFTEQSEPVLRIQREIDQIEATLRSALSAQLSERIALARSVEQRLLSLNSGEVALEVLERDRMVASQNYQNYARRREEARIGEELDLRRVSNISVLNPAEQPIEPVGPKKLLLTGLALPFGLIAGIGLALLMEYLNRSIRDENDLPRGLGLEYLGPMRLNSEV